MCTHCRTVLNGFSEIGQIHQLVSLSFTLRILVSPHSFINNKQTCLKCDLIDSSKQTMTIVIIRAQNRQINLKEHSNVESHTMWDMFKYLLFTHKYIIKVQRNFS